MSATVLLRLYGNVLYSSHVSDADECFEKDALLSLQPDSNSRSPHASTRVLQ